MVGHALVRGCPTNTVMFQVTLACLIDTHVCFLDTLACIIDTHVCFLDTLACLIDTACAS